MAQQNTSPDHRDAHENFGEKISYDQTWKGPLHFSRSKTDKSWLLCIAVYVFIWLSLAIYVHHNIKKTVEVRFIGSHQLSRYEYQTDSSKYREISTGIGDHVQKAYPFILLGTLLTASYILMLRWFAKTFVWTIIYLVFGVLICNTVYFGKKYLENKPGGSLAFVYATILFAFALYIHVLKKRIDIACEVVREACKALMVIPSTLFIPFFTALLIFLVVAFACYVYGLVIGAKLLQQSTTVTPILQLMNAFGVYWICSFIYNTSYMILSMTFAAWYWVHDKNQLVRFPLLKAAKITFRYHLGTVAIGSLVVLICELIVKFLKKIKKTIRSCCCCFYCNPLAWIINCCFGLFLNHFLKVVECLNRNACIYTATHGTSFFTSASSAFNLLMRNLLRVYAIGKVSTLVIRLGKCVVIMSTLGIKVAYELSEGHNGHNYNWDATEICLIFGVTFITVELVFMVLNVAIDTIFLSVLEDSERNDGSASKPYFMSFKLKVLVLKESDPPIEYV